MTVRWRVRRAEAGDVAAMDAMVHELAEYEREPDAVEATPDDLRAALFGPSPVASAHVAEVLTTSGGTEGWQVAGMALWFPTYSTWTGRSGVWLEDLFVTPERRGLGLGRALLAALAAEVVARGGRRLEWSVLDWNTPAQEVYAKVGASPMDDWTTWRLTGPALTELAARSGGQSPGSHPDGPAPGGRGTMGVGPVALDGVPVGAQADEEATQ